MSTLSKKLFISVLTLVLTVGAFAATTFAWFTLGNTATVGTFTGDVTTGEGLEVRIGTSGAWTNYISQEEIQAYIDDVAAFTAFNAIFSENGISFKKLVIDGTNLSYTADGLDSEYISIPLQFRSTSEGVIHLSSVVFGHDNVNAWANDGLEFRDANNNVVASYDDDEPGAVTEYVSNAARVSIVDGANVLVVEQTEGDNGNVIGKGTNAVGAHSFFKSRFDESVGTAYDGLFDSAELPTTVQASAVTSDLVANPNPVVTLSENTIDFNNISYHTASVTVNVWIEGWDANTYNALFAQTLEVSLAFKKAE